ncbi:zinc ribbon domain-containing protein [archaeon]|nr:zinc ribbon domain-containing protein [archaeon]
MPIYSYACSECGYKQDHLLKSNESLIECPNCHTNKYSKQLTAPGSFTFKGAGAYQTDYKTSCGADAKEVKQIGCGGNCACH